ncbi:MAG: universal stress protein [Polyangiaceae bacterium]|nr:universal stress protein [Polyangiaceae bacterium]
MTIICATDFSPSSEAALVVTSIVASKSPDEEVEIVHAMEYPNQTAPQADLDRARREAATKLGEAVTRFRALAGREARSLLLYGSPVEAIPELAAVRKPSLVVVGSVGRGERPLLRVGGTAERIAQRLTAPLLVVRNAEPFEAWRRNERPMRVLLGVDNESSWCSALRWVNRLRTAGPCALTIAQIYYPHDERERYGLPRAKGLAERDAEIEELLIRDMKSRIVIRGEGPVEFRPVLGIGRLGDHLVDLAHSESTDLIALGTHQRAGLLRFASVTNVTLHYARSAVLVVPQADEVSDARPPRRILVGTDLSHKSGKAIAEAYALVEGRPGAEVVLLYVEDSVVAQSLSAPPEELLRQLIPQGRGEQSRVLVARHVDPAKGICSEAERIGADVICVGSHGRTGASRMVLGSVAEQVVRNSRRPVLVVRSDAEV